MSSVMFIGIFSGVTEPPTVTPVTPDPPTSGVVDDDANTFDFTLSTGFSLGDHEYSINGGAYTTVTSTPISVGDINVAIGQLLVRVKAIGANPPSATLSNASAFTVDGTTYFARNTFEGPIYDDGYYNGYSFVDQHNNGMISDLFKSTGQHTAVGPLLLALSYDGGNTWDFGQCRVDGVLVGAVALWKHLYKTGPYAGRMLIGYQDDEIYRHMKFAWSDNPASRLFTSAPTWDFGADDVSSPCPIPAVEMPDGDVRFYYYKLKDYFVDGGSGADKPYVVASLTTRNGGLTYADEGEIVFNNDDDFPTNFPYCKCHESSVIITELGETNATTKMVCFSRVQIPMEGGTYFLVKHSPDGGATWSYDVTEDTGSFVDTNGVTQGGPFSRALNYTFVAGNHPPRLFAYNGWIYCIVGVRNGSGYELQWSRATPAGAYRNKWDDWSRPVIMRAYNAYSLGNSIDCGYPGPYINKISAEDTIGQLMVHDYDISTETRDPLITEDRAWVYQQIIEDIEEP